MKHQKNSRKSENITIFFAALFMCSFCMICSFLMFVFLRPPKVVILSETFEFDGSTYELYFVQMENMEPISCPVVKKGFASRLVYTFPQFTPQESSKRIDEMREAFPEIQFDCAGG